MVALSAPVYWVGLMVVRFFTPGGGFLELSFFPLPTTYVPLTEDPGRWLHGLIVPWIVLALPLAAMCLRMMRASMRDVLDEDYVRTARAKGLAGRVVIRRHAVPAAVSPVIGLAGANMALVVTNAVLVEQVFNIPGVFRSMTVAMAEGDFPVLQGIVIAGAVLVVAASFIADVVQAWLDPRIRT